MTRALVAAALSLTANMLRNSGKSGLCRPWVLTGQISQKQQRFNSLTTGLSGSVSCNEANL